MRDLISPLAKADNIGLVGGKAKALGELIRAGFNVPSGFVVPTASSMKMTKQLTDEVLKNFDKLNTAKVAVRSSAVSEDSKSAAWAGQFDTFLNTDQAHLIENVKKCWASANSKRAKSYAEEKGLKSGQVAVIVQKMVPAQVAGVTFSVNPVTNDRNQMIIEVVQGLGESLVSGRVTPDSYLIDKNDGQIIEQNLTNDKPKLKAEQIRQLYQKIKEIEGLFGFPVDVEWAFAKDELFILQSRPITTL